MSAMPIRGISYLTQTLRYLFSFQAVQRVWQPCSVPQEARVMTCIMGILATISSLSCCSHVGSLGLCAEALLLSVDVIVHCSYC